MVIIMKKSVRIFCIVAAVCAAAGIIVWLIGMSAIGWDFTRLDGTKYTASSYAATQEIKKIDVKLDTFPIKVMRGESVSLEYYEATGSTVTVTDDDGVLEIKEDYKYDPFKVGFFNFSKSEHAYVLTVTDGVEFDFTGSSSAVTFENMQFTSLAIKSTNSALMFVNTTVEALDIVATNAAVNMNDCTVGDITVKSTNLNIVINRTAGNKLIATATNLHADIDNCEFASASLTATNIDIDANSLTVADLSVSGINVNCDIHTLKGMYALYIKGTNISADIVISGIQAEYSFDMHGKNLPSNSVGSTDKKITVYGTNNDVKLKFVETN